MKTEKHIGYILGLWAACREVMMSSEFVGGDKKPCAMGLDCNCAVCRIHERILVVERQDELDAALTSEAGVT